MKKFISLLIVLTVILSIAGCGAKRDDKAAEDGVATIKAAEDSVTTIKATMTAESKEKFVEETTAEPESIDIYSNDSNPDDLSGTNGAAIISEEKIKKEQIRAANIETLSQIIDNEELDAASKQAAVDEMTEITEISQRETATELLLSTRGYDCLVTIVDDSVEVVVNETELTDEQRAWIEDIVGRRTDCSADKIIISLINDLQ